MAPPSAIVATIRVTLSLLLSVWLMLLNCFLEPGFELTPAARKNVKNAFMAARNYANPQIGMGISGRRPFKGSNVHGIKEIYRMLALAGNAEDR